MNREQIPLQSTSIDIWQSKYQLKDDFQNPVDNTVDDTYKRVAKALASVEKESDFWYEKFLYVLRNGATPAGRIMANAGADDYKPATTLINCTVSQLIPDSISGIMNSASRAAITLASGAGIGYEFSTLRPKGSYVSGAGAFTSGSLSFMDIFDKMCFTISSAGGRRGAQMATFAVWHPDVFAFIDAKREDGRFRQFNMSLLIDDDFMNAVMNDDIWHLRFPIRQIEIDKGIVKLDSEELIWYKNPWNEDYCNRAGYITKDGNMLFKIWETVRAKDIWEKIMRSTYDYAEPGFILIDHVNRMNNNYWCETIRATNPCVHGDTIIDTINGRKKIKDIKEPTMVYSMNENGALVLKKASAAWKSKENADTIKITIKSGKEIIVTPDHKIYVRDEGWKEAKDLKIGDMLVQLCRSRHGPCYSAVKLSTQNDHDYVLEQRLIANAAFGITDTDIVYHKDGNTYNNSIDNLEIERMVDLNSTEQDSVQLSVVSMPEELKSNMRNSQSACVSKIEKGPIADVYDIQVNDTHNFVANFMIVHNCGEQCLPPDGSCLLGSINLTTFIKNPFTDNASFDWNAYKDCVRVFSRMLDNVVEINGLPLEEQRNEIESKRRHGMGFMGLGSSMNMLGMQYGDEASVKFTEEVSKVMAIISYEAGIELAEEKGPAPILKKYDSRVAWSKSEFMQQIWKERPDLLERAINSGCRYTHATSVAPTGCQHEDTLIVTENGIIPLHHLISDHFNELEGPDIPKNAWHELNNVWVATDKDRQYATRSFVNGFAETVKIRTDGGTWLEATPNHQYRILTDDGEYEWKRSDELKPGDALVVKMNTYFKTTDAPLEVYNFYEHFPKEMSPKLAEFLGIYYAVNVLFTKSRNDYSMFFNADFDVVHRMKNLLKELFSIDSELTEITSGFEKIKNLKFHSVYLQSWFEMNNIIRGNDANIEFPAPLLRSSRVSIESFIDAFHDTSLQNYYLYTGDGNYTYCTHAKEEKNYKFIDTYSRTFVQELQIVSRAIGRNVHIKDITSGMGKEMYRAVFMDSFTNKESDPDALLRLDMLDATEVLSELDVFNATVDRVRSIDYGFSMTLDIEVPVGNAYIANGIVSHNTISLSVNNNISNGIEPSFSHKYTRNVIRSGKKSKEAVDVYSYELLLYKHLTGNDDAPSSWKSADNISAKDHISIQAAAQKWVDSSVSKTCNVPSNMPFDDFKDLYMMGYKSKLKGLTTFRYNPEAFQGVLVKDDDLKNTTYAFILNDGSEVVCKGTDEIFYDGETHRASNLYDSIKEGYYGKF
jgi:ribonucleotide reductase alpha subunit